MEVILSYLTDAIITINKQDYDIIQSPFSSADKFLIHGMGVDEARFRPFRAEERSTVRILNGYTDEDFILIYVGEFIERKNHEFIIQTVPSLKRLIPGIKVLFAGRGVLLEKMKLLAHELGIADEINFLSFRDDVNVWMALSDIGISSSKQEGLGLNLAEEMLCELPIIATKDRGHQELIEHGRNGYLFDQNNKEQFVDCVFKLYRDKELRTKFALNSAAKGLSFTLSRSIKSMTEIYGRYLKD
jgi:glycosyltransferase EpsD